MAKYYNAEHYSDPTAGVAIERADRSLSYMPTKARKYCKKCGKIATVGEYCEDHAPKRDYSSEYLRRSTKDTDKWYKQKAWQIRRAMQLRKQPLCEECLKRGEYVKATDVDHIEPHKGNYEVFIDPDNLQSLCHECHSRKTAKENKKHGIWV